MDYFCWDGPLGVDHFVNKNDIPAYLVCSRGKTINASSNNNVQSTVQPKEFTIFSHYFFIVIFTRAAG